MAWVGVFWWWLSTKTFVQFHLHLEWLLTLGDIFQLCGGKLYLCFILRGSTACLLASSSPLGWYIAVLVTLPWEMLWFLCRLSTTDRPPPTNNRTCVLFIVKLLCSGQYINSFCVCFELVHKLVLKGMPIFYFVFLQRIQHKDLFLELTDGKHQDGVRLIIEFYSGTLCLNIN